MLNKNKKKLLLVCDSHTHVILNVYKILSKKFYVTMYCPNKYKETYRKNFRKKIKFYNYVTLEYLYLIFKSFLFDYIFLNTGPEYGNKKNGLFILFCYWFFLFFHGQKTTMGIRDASKYFIGAGNNINDSLQNYIRNKSIMKVKVLFFETKTIMNSFKEKFKNFNIKCLVNYPLHLKQSTSFKPKKKNNFDILRVGVLGTLSVVRRNYNILINSINLLPKAKREKINLIFIGTVDDGYKNETIIKLSKFVKIYCRKGYLSQYTFENLASSCHLLISPQRKGCGGKVKGTGSTFDAILANKRLIIPEYADPEKEFFNFCYYYKNKYQLKKRLTYFMNFFKKGYRPLEKKIFFQYTNQKLIKDLLKNLV
jgi:hypothetical protein